MVFSTARIRCGKLAPDRYSGSRSTKTPYLSHLEELRQLGHPVQERLVDLQGFFALVLLHVKVFLCSPQRGERGGAERALSTILPCLGDENVSPQTDQTVKILHLNRFLGR